MRLQIFCARVSFARGVVFTADARTFQRAHYARAETPARTRE
jgi:hypothetical protein